MELFQLNPNFCFYLENRLIQTSQTGGQWYSDTSPLSIPCLNRHSLVSYDLLPATLVNARFTIYYLVFLSNGPTDI